MEGKMMRLCALIAMLSIWMVLAPCYGADVTLDVGSASVSLYSTMLTNLRTKVTDPTLKYGGTNIPVMAKPKTAGYIFVDLKASNGGTITIAMRNSDLYFLGYADTLNGKPRGHFFADVPEAERTKIFAGVKDKKDYLVFPFGSGYDSMEGPKGANMDRKKIGLGPKPLNKWINTIYGAQPNAKNEAQFMLVAIQTIAEAMRFKYIENMVVANFDTSYNPDLKALKLEKNWQVITKAIKNSKNKVISPPLMLVDANGKDWQVSKVDDIAPDMALLKNEGK